ncbi:MULTISPECIES: helix-turn-helix domain-containing protein [Lactobacillus]|uniref:Helix-turn-helix domain-containing protein n=1 Tax=Lactobacillus xujianguonis TaxID=2495899 RepID=A0A437SSH2_9LACO|nr:MULTISPECIES: helix-turn-helix domain-containing protein [Lactobacillus]RVU69802.1 helix-turn-helix domain-containing protein [Lactobacillus xujianguonis]RVU71900.1 helix-turn-helix domain-containing protein [Lactobacillus xujianguonis]
MENYIDMAALDHHFSQIARRVFLEEHAKQSGISKNELRDMVRMMVQQRAFNRKDAAKYIGKTPSYINQLVDKGLLKSTVNNGSKYYLKEDLDEYLESGITTRKAI